MNWKRPTSPFNKQVLNFKELNIEAIENAATVIRKGGVVAFPTETVYGLGADALNPVAVAKIFQLKERPSFDPLIVHIASLNSLELLSGKPNENVLLLAKHFWPGPLTIVLPKSNLVPDIVTSGLDTVGIRMPDNKIALGLIQKAGCPIAAPSANKFGQLSPTSASHVKKQLPGVDFILDGGNTSVGIESTIVSIDDDLCTILRPGKITLDDIKNVLPPNFRFITGKTDKIVAPGLLKSHYSPQKPLFILSETPGKLPVNSGLIVHSSNRSQLGAKRTILTSQNSNLLEIASGLFSALHAMEDDKEITQIFIEPVIETGLGIAIMDRIKKAAHQYKKD